MTLLAVDVVGLDIGIIRFIGIIIVVVITALVDLLSDQQANASAGNDGKSVGGFCEARIAGGHGPGASRH